MHILTVVAFMFLQQKLTYKTRNMKLTTSLFNHKDKISKGSTTQ